MRKKSILQNIFVGLIIFCPTIAAFAQTTTFTTITSVGMCVSGVGYPRLSLFGFAYQSAVAGAENSSEKFSGKTRLLSNKEKL